MKQRGGSIPLVTLHLYANSNGDGLFICPEHPKGKLSGPDGRKRIFVGCEYVSGNHIIPDRLGEMNDLQIRALIDLAFRIPGIHNTALKARFYDAQVWAESWDNRRKLLFEVELP